MPVQGRYSCKSKARANAQNYVWKHFYYRVLGLIIWPFVLYLSFFWIHFKVLKYSGPGDSFMSPAFQETLSGNEMLLNAQGTFSIAVEQGFRVELTE